MNPRTIIFVVVALVIAGGTAMLVQNWMKSQRAALMAQMPKQKPKEQSSQIIVAKRDLAAGTIIKPDHLEWQAWPEAKINAAYLQKGKHKEKDLVGAVVRVGIAAGEPMSEGRVVKPGDRGFLAAVLAPGTRAMTIGINATTGIAGFIFPGDRVDIILSHRVAGFGGRRRVSETILENARIIAVDQVTADNQNKATLRRTATLELTPKQVEFLTVAKTLGSLSFSLRSLRKEDVGIVLDVDPNDPGNSEPAVRGKTYTSENEVSRLLGGVEDGQTHVMTVVRGKKSEVTRLRSITR